VSAVLLAVALALPQAPAPEADSGTAVSAQNHGGAHGWVCSAVVEVDGYRGGVLRHFGADSDHSPYIVTVHEPGDHRGRHSVTWTIHPDPAGPQPTRKRSFRAGRKQADAFRSGPDFVHIHFAWYTRVEGPVWAHYWGDGAYAGADRLMTARSARRFRDKDGLTGGISGGLSARPLLTALAGARTWQVVAVDATGKQLFSDSFQLPRWQAAEAEFRRARARLDALEAEFRKDHEPREQSDAACADHDDPNSTI